MSNTYLLAATLLNGSPTPPPTIPPVDSPAPVLKTNFSSSSTPPSPATPLVENPPIDLTTNFPPDTSRTSSVNPSLASSQTSDQTSSQNQTSGRLWQPQLRSPLFPEPTPDFNPVPLNFTAPPPPVPQAYLSPELPRPKSGSQMLSQRVAALQAGVTYTRIPTDSFMESWQKADPRDPTYEQWQSLLIQEAKALAYGQGNNPLSVIVGDSLTMWFPPDKLSKNNLWLNQGISGENTTQILRRLKYKDFGQTKPDRIYVMAGINDLRQGAADQTILNNHRQIMRQLHKDYPQAEIIVQSILPTRFASIPDRRLRYLNQQLEMITAQEGVSFLDIYDVFLNQEGQLRRELTTDGIHLSMAGYEAWSWSINQ